MPALIASTTFSGSRTAILPHGYVVRTVQPTDIPALGRLYFASYPPAMLEATAEEAHEDIVATFAGDYGELWLEASPVIEASGEVVCAVLTVRRAPWEDVPSCPFVIEVVTDVAHRRRGLARAR